MTRIDRLAATVREMIGADENATAGNQLAADASRAALDELAALARENETLQAVAADKDTTWSELLEAAEARVSELEAARRERA